VEVQMAHGLASVTIGIDYRAVAGQVNFLELGHSPRRLEERTGNGHILFIKIIQADNVLFRNNQHMHWRLGVDIFKS
jgi:hypothetical protein